MFQTNPDTRQATAPQAATPAAANSPLAATNLANRPQDLRTLGTRAAQSLVMASLLSTSSAATPDSVAGLEASPAKTTFVQTATKGVIPTPAEAHEESILRPAPRKEVTAKFKEVSFTSTFTQKTDTGDQEFFKADQVTYGRSLATATDKQYMKDLFEEVSRRAPELSHIRDLEDARKAVLGKYATESQKALLKDNTPPDQQKIIEQAVTAQTALDAAKQAGDPAALELAQKNYDASQKALLQIPENAQKIDISFTLRSLNDPKHAAAFMQRMIGPDKKLETLTAEEQQKLLDRPITMSVKVTGFRKLD